MLLLLVAVALCQNHIFSDAPLVYQDFLKILHRHSLCERNLQLDSVRSAQPNFSIYTGFIPSQLMTNTSDCCYSL